MVAVYLHPRSGGITFYLGADVFCNGRSVPETASIRSRLMNSIHPGLSQTNAPCRVQRQASYTAAQMATIGEKYINAPGAHTNEVAASVRMLN